MTKEDCDNLAKVYRDNCRTKDGVLRRKDFIKLLNIKHNSFSDLLFERFCPKSYDALCLLDFICSVWSFLSQHESAIGSYIFFLFDKENTGRLSIEVMRDMFEMIKEYHVPACTDTEKDWMKRDIKHVLHSVEIKKLGYMSLQKMDDWSRAHLNLFRYFSDMLKIGRENVISVDFWKKQEKNRSRDINLLLPNYIYSCLREVKCKTNKPQEEVKVWRVKKKHVNNKKQRDVEDESTHTAAVTTTSESSGNMSPMNHTPPKSLLTVSKKVRNDLCVLSFIL